MRYPRVLTISNCAFSYNNSNGRTLSGFFLNWDKDALAQLFIQPEIPNTSVCNHFFRITDYEVLKTLFSPRVYGMPLSVDKISQVRKQNTRTDAGLEKVILSSRIKKSSFFSLLRNFLWFSSHWYSSDELREWLREFSPEVIFYQAGNDPFMYNIAIKISQRFSIPLIVYSCEDYYLKKAYSFSPPYCLQRFLQRRGFRRLMKHTSHVIYSHDQLKASFEEHFTVPAHTVMAASTITPYTSCRSNSKLTISYLGNTGLNRWKSLLDIGRALQGINESFYVDVYTQRLDPKAKTLTSENGVRVRGAIGYNSVVEIMQKSDLLLHVEDFSDHIRRDLKHAFSTKIADSLASGTCLFAYGPEDIASIQYLKENSAAHVVTQKSELKSALVEILTDEQLRNKYVERALDLARERHNPEINTKIFEEVVECVVAKHR